MTLIEVPSWGTMSLIEALWLGSGLTALVFALLRMRPLWDDMRNVRDLKEDDLCVIAKGYLRRELIRLAQATCVISVGLYSAAEPSAIPGPTRVSIVGLVITTVLITISALIALQSYLDWRNRTAIKRILEGSL